MWLLFISIAFYSLIDIRFPIILLIFSFASFLIAKQIEKESEPKRKNRWLISGLVVVVGLLILFKYLSFFLGAANSALAAAGLKWDFRGSELFYPIGVSFYSLQIISYLVDVFYGRVQAETNFGLYALYVSFFPKLLSGPMERYGQLKPQFTDIKPFDYQEFIDNLVRIGWGLFKKIVIADRLAVIANTVFDAPQNFYSTQQIFALIAFSLQIYIDFSAYCDIAIGVARILGINLTENFNLPYFAESVADFWRRWHISLSNWLRDYIFLPLNIQNRRKKPLKLWTCIDVLITFLISGLWHGEKWTFIIWGGLHGMYQAFEIATQELRDRMVSRFSIDRNTFAHKSFQILFTFGLVTFTWLFFRANSVSDAVSILKSVLSLRGVSLEKAWIFNDGSLGLDGQDMWMLGNALLVFLIVEFASRKQNLISALNRQSIWFRWSIYLFFILAILIFGFYGGAVTRDFVYFKF